MDRVVVATEEGNRSFPGWQVSWDADPSGRWTAKLITNVQRGGERGGTGRWDSTFANPSRVICISTGISTRWARQRVPVVCTARVPQTIPPLLRQAARRSEDPGPSDRQLDPESHVETLGAGHLV